MQDNALLTIGVDQRRTCREESRKRATFLLRNALAGSLSARTRAIRRPSYPTDMAS